MKCLVLAGGCSDSLWPLSRKDFPKQFMEVVGGRSMFQDAVLRNMPFCSEFVIVTNKKFENVIKAQLQDFQGIEYSVLLEEDYLDTAPSVIITALNSDADEELLIVSAEGIIAGDYIGCITQAVTQVRSDKIAVVVTPPSNNGLYNYINLNGNKIVFGGKPLKKRFCDCGIMAAKASVLLDAVDGVYLERCKNIAVRKGVISKKQTYDLEPMSLGKVLDTSYCTLVCAQFDWVMLNDLSSFYRLYGKTTDKDNNAVTYNCKGLEIINTVDDQLIVANGLKNLVIVNTRDAIYVSSGEREADIQNIAEQFYEFNKNYFDKQAKVYKEWGIIEHISSCGDVSLNLITVYPGQSYLVNAGATEISNYFIAEGNAKLITGKNIEIHHANESMVLHGEPQYVISNIGNANLLLSQTLKTYALQEAVSNKPNNLIVKLVPVYKDNLWGGTKIRDVLGKDVGDMDIIAESWELSAHPDGESKIATGLYRGKTFNEYIKRIGKSKLGWKGQTYDKFPLMVKFIDAKSALSIQVHPDDNYAFSVEGEYGKNEMWYIMDADDDAYIYVGFKRYVSKDEIKKRIQNNTLVQVLNKIPVKKGETYFLKAGTVHAIGEGCFICEVQQSSNITYRLYDYGRRDKDGNLRELHINKALDVLNNRRTDYQSAAKPQPVYDDGFVKTQLGQCKYFTVTKYDVTKECALYASDSSFKVVVVINGRGQLIDSNKNRNNIQIGDTWFIASGEQVTIAGTCTALVVNI